MTTGDSHIGSNSQHRLSDQVSANTADRSARRPSACQRRRCPAPRNSPGTRCRTRRAPPCRPWPSRARRSGPRSTGCRPAPTLASSAFRRSFIEVRSWRCHTQRTPAGEIDRPRRFSASETRTWPQAGCSIASSTDRLFDLRRRAVLQDRLLAADLLQRQFTAFVVQLLEPVEAVAAIPHHLAGLADVAELLGQLQQPDLRSDNLLLLGQSWSPSRRRTGRGPGSW